jgi:nucleoside-diphosphate-sugar epimerase
MISSIHFTSKVEQQNNEIFYSNLFNLVDQIYHLASPASPPHYMYNPIKTIKVNTIGTINMLGLARRVRAQILLASTSEVYGDPEVHPQTESYFGNVNSFGPRACYDESKRVAEAMFYAYAEQVCLQKKHEIIKILFDFILGKYFYSYSSNIQYLWTTYAYE